MFVLSTALSTSNWRLQVGSKGQQQNQGGSHFITNRDPALYAANEALPSARCHHGRGDQWSVPID